MKLINIYLIGQIYICNIYIRSTSPIKYIAWNNEIISWGLCLLCMYALGYRSLGMVMECCGSYWGLYMVWNNEIISWRLCWLCMAAFWLAVFLENGLELGLISECCGSYWGLYMVLLLLVV